MPIVINNRTYRNDFNNSTTNFLCGNIGTWNRFEFELETSISVVGTFQNTFSTPFSNQIIMMSGNNWKDYGFDVGMTFTVVCVIKSGVTLTPVSITATITSLHKDTLVHNGTIDFSAWSVIPSNNGTDEVKNLIITSTSTLDAISLKYSLIKNSDSQNTTLNSIIDSSETELVCTGLSSLAINGELNFSKVGIQSGMALDICKIKYLSNTSGIKTYKVTIDFLIHGFYSSISDFDNKILPEWYLGSETLTDNIYVKFMPQFNNPNVFIQNDMSWTAQLGNVGWLNENYNGLQDAFNVLSVNYSTINGTVSSLVYNDETTVVATISGLTNPSDALLKLQYGILWATGDDTVYSSNNFGYHKNLKMNINGNIGFSGSSILVSNPVNNTLKQGFSKDNARIDVTSIDFTVSGANIIMTMKVVCTGDFQTQLESNADDRRYLIWLAIGDQNLAVNNSNRVSKIIDANTFQKYVAPAGPYDNMSSNFIAHHQTTADIGQPFYNGFVEDDVLFNGRFAVNVYDQFILESVEFRVEVINSTTKQRYTLESKNVNVSAFPSDVNGIQQINYVDSRGFKYDSGDEKNLVSIVRDTTLDDSQFKYYKFLYGFKIRWEDWIARAGVPSAFFIANPPINGFNNDWFHYYSVAVWDLIFTTYLSGTLNGVDVNYEDSKPIIVHDYDSNPNITKEIKTYKDSDNTLLTAGIDPLTGKDTGVILDGENTRIEVDYELISGDWVQGEQYGTICIQVWNGAGEPKFRQISTIVSHESDNPLIPLVGESFCNISYPATNIVRLKCLVEPSLLDDAVNYQISSRLGCKSTEDGFIFTTSQLVQNTNNVTLKPTV